MSESIKHDSDKLPLHLVDPQWLESTAHVLAFGQKKYSAWNWAQGTFAWSRLYGALLRHLAAFWQGEEYDKETGLPHIWHANCCMMFLSRYYNDELGTDDRPHRVAKALHSGNRPPTLQGDDFGRGTWGGRGAPGDTLLRDLGARAGSVPGGSRLEPRGGLQDERVQDSAPEQQARDDIPSAGRMEGPVRNSLNLDWEWTK